MDLSQLITEINELADEQEDNSIIIGFINDAIARINVMCDSNFPSVKATDSEIPYLPEKWIRTMIIPFGVGRVKQRDSSEFEFSNAYQEFTVALLEFKAKFPIPDEYKDQSSASEFEGDILSKPNWNYGGW